MSFIFFSNSRNFLQTFSCKRKWKCHLFTLHFHISSCTSESERQTVVSIAKKPMWHSGNKSSKNVVFLLFVKKYVKYLKYVIFLKRANISFYIFTYFSWVQKYGTFIEYFNPCVTLNWMVKEFRIQFHVVLILFLLFTAGKEMGSFFIPKQRYQKWSNEVVLASKSQLTLLSSSCQ